MQYGHTAETITQRSHSPCKLQDLGSLPYFPSSSLDFGPRRPYRGALQNQLLHRLQSASSPPSSCLDEASISALYQQGLAGASETMSQALEAKTNARRDVLASELTSWLQRLGPSHSTSLMLVPKICWSSWRPISSPSMLPLIYLALITL